MHVYFAHIKLFNNIKCNEVKSADKSSNLFRHKHEIFLGYYVLFSRVRSMKTSSCPRRYICTFVIHTHYYQSKNTVSYCCRPIYYWYESNISLNNDQNRFAVPGIGQQRTF